MSAGTTLRRAGATFILATALLGTGAFDAVQASPEPPGHSRSVEPNKKGSFDTEKKGSFDITADAGQDAGVAGDPSQWG